MSRRGLMTVDRFAPEAKALRTHLDERFADPRSAGAGRFVWDWWHVPEQYTVLRTPAWQYFPPKLYQSFHERLVWWGRRVLGCHDVSPPWLSCYVDGCEQHLHGDLPHGQWAWVFSLTRWDTRRFTGGETLILKDQVLDYWRGFTSTRWLEENELCDLVEPRFNRLVVFDPRLPHAVRRVQGVQDPAQGRLVVHGWFVQPRPFIEGALAPKQLERAIDAVSDGIAPRLTDGLEVAGMASFNFTVERSGAVRGVRLLCDTTRTVEEADGERRALLQRVGRTLSAFRFPRQRGASQVTLPLVFER